MFSVMTMPKSTITPIGDGDAGEAHDVRADAEQMHHQQT
jgi:hypothetical protein